MHWKYKRKPDPTSHFGFVYIITNKKTSKCYIGCKQYWHYKKGKKARQSVNKIKNSGRTHAHKIQAAIAMSQRAKVASQRAKDPQKKKDLGQAHKIYQNYIDTNKKSKD